MLTFRRRVYVLRDQRILPTSRVLAQSLRAAQEDEVAPHMLAFHIMSFITLRAAMRSARSTSTSRGAGSFSWRAKKNGTIVAMSIGKIVAGPRDTFKHSILYGEGIMSSLYKCYT
jgi:hypothetical protein